MTEWALSGFEKRCKTALKWFAMLFKFRSGSATCSYFLASCRSCLNKEKSPRGRLKWGKPIIHSPARKNMGVFVYAKLGTRYKPELRTCWRGRLAGLGGKWVQHSLFHPCANGHLKIGPYYVKPICVRKIHISGVTDSEQAPVSGRLQWEKKDCKILQ